MRSQQKKLLLKPTAYIDILLGTAVKQITAMASFLACKSGIDLEHFLQHLFIDWQSKLNCTVGDGINFESGELFGPEEFIEAVLPDSEALAKAEQAGMLWVVPEGFHRNPGAVAEKMGAGGNPRYGLLLTQLFTRTIKSRLRKAIQKGIDHHRYSPFLFAGMEETDMPVRVTIKLQFSAIGGMGSGAMHWFIGPNGVKSCARENGVEASLILQVTCRGNLDVKDNEKADLNESIALQNLLVRNSGAYVSPHTGTIGELPQDILFLFGNQNNHGDMTSFEQVLAHQGHCDHFLFQTRGGARMRELLVDIQDSEYTPDGEPLFAKAMACGHISRNSDRMLTYLTYRAASDLAEVVASPGDPERIQQLAANVARQSGIVDSNLDSQATNDLMHPAELGSEDITETAKASLVARCRGHRGLGQAIAADSALRVIRHNDVSEVYVPSMRRQAESRREEDITRVEDHLRRIMKTEQGFWDGQEFVRCLKLIAEQSVQSVMAKITELQESLQPHEEILGEASERTETLAQRNWVVRTASYPLAQRIASTILESGRVAIDLQLQIAACEIAINDLLMPLIDYLDNRLQWLSAVENKLMQTQQICMNKAESKALESTIHMVPLGFELTSGQYLQDFYADFAASKGGRGRFAALLLNEFLRKHESLSFLADAPLEEYERAFAAVGDEVFRPEVENTDVVGELKRLFPTKAKRRRLFDRVIKQCEGSFRTTGEANQPVVWIKVAHAPFPEHVPWLKDMLETTDKKPGPWEVFALNDPDRITLAQLRGGISIQSHLKRIALPDNPESWTILVDHAPDPGTVLTVPPGPTLRQFRRVLAKAIVTGQLTTNHNGDFEFSSSDGETIPLGNCFDSVEQALWHRWPELIFIESTFNRNLVVDEDRVLATLRDMTKRIPSDAPDDPRLSLVDLTALKESGIQAELLISRFRRIPRANQRRLSR